MKMFKLALPIAFALAACSGPLENEPEESKGEVCEHLLVQGKPFLMLGAQLRTDYFIKLDGRGYDQLDDYFSLAADMGIMCIQVPVCWADVETSKDVYDSSWVDALIGYCEKYDMKLEILWYGSYMCGYSCEGYVPNYVVVNPAIYAPLATGYNGWLGKQYWLDPYSRKLVEREAIAIGKMMDFVEAYDNTHGHRHTVIGVQVENEPDMLATRHNSAHGLSADKLWPGIIDLLDELGKVVKASKYECYTRANITLDNGYVENCAKIVEREGIDYVGLDPYQSSISDILGRLRELEIPGNYPHIAENGGEYVNNDVLIMEALSLGYGYEVFEVITTPHEYLKDWTLRGIYNPDFTPKSHTQRMVEIFRTCRAGWVDLAEASADKITCFNIAQDNAEAVKNCAVKAGPLSFTWSTQKRGLGYAVERDSYCTVASTKLDVISFSAGTPSSVEKGYYNTSREWVCTGNAEISGGKLILDPTSAYRINY